MEDLWILYNQSFDNEELNSAKKMLNEALKQEIDATLLFSDYFTINNDIYYKGVKVDNFPKVIFYRGRDEVLIKEFEIKGVKVINGSYATITCKDKYLTFEALKKLHIKQPKTLLLENKTYKEYYDIFNSRFIIKNRYGAQGKDIYLINNETEYNEVIKSIIVEDYIIQEFIETSYGKDIRVYLIGNKVVGAMERKNDNGFLANVYQGALSYDYTLTKEQIEESIKISLALKGDIISVDFLVGDNSLIFCEANTNAGFSSFIYLGYDMRALMMRYIKSLIMNK